MTSCDIYKSFIRDNVSSEHVLCSRQDSKGSHALCRGDSGSFSIYEYDDRTAILIKICDLFKPKDLHQLEILVKTTIFENAFNSFRDS